MMKGFLAGVFVGVCFFVFVGNAGADEIGDGEVGAKEVEASGADGLFERDSLTGGLFGLHDALKEHGIKAELRVAPVYQQNVHGGSSTHRTSGRFAGTYDYEFGFDLEKILNLKGGEFVLTAEGWWSDGITGPAVGSILPVNAVACQDLSVAITEAFWETVSGLGNGVRGLGNGVRYFFESLPVQNRS